MRRRKVHDALDLKDKWSCFFSNSIFALSTLAFLGVFRFSVCLGGSASARAMA